MFNKETGSAFCREGSTAARHFVKLYCLVYIFHIHGPLNINGPGACAPRAHGYFGTAYSSKLFHSKGKRKYTRSYTSASRPAERQGSPQRTEGRGKKAGWEEK